MQHDNIQNRNDQNLWNFIFSILFILFLVILVITLYRVRGTLPTSISLPDTLLIALASFRVVRLFVYDKITRFIRDLFYKLDERYTEEGVTYFEHIEFSSGWRRTISDLLNCPWCFSIWSVSVVSFFYFLTPLSWLPLFILALSGVASLIQLSANLIGWSAEKKKLEAKRLEKEL